MWKNVKEKKKKGENILDKFLPLLFSYPSIIFLFPYDVFYIAEWWYQFMWKLS